MPSAHLTAGERAIEDLLLSVGQWFGVVLGLQGAGAVQAVELDDEPVERESSLAVRSDDMNPNS